MAEENFDIFEDFQEQDFKNSEEYFDYLKKTAEDYKEFKTSPEQVQRDKDAAIDALKFPVNVAAEIGNLGIGLAEMPLDIFDFFSGAKSEDDKIPRIPTIPYRNPEMEVVDDVAAVGVAFFSPMSYLRGIDFLAKTSPKAFKVLKEAHPYWVGQMYDAYKKGGIKEAASSFLPYKYGSKAPFKEKYEVAIKLGRNISAMGGLGLVDRVAGSPVAENIFPQPVDMPVEEVDDVITIQPSDLESDSPPNIRGSEYFVKEAKVVDRKAYGGEPELQTNILEVLKANDPDKELREKGELPPLQEFESNVDIFEEAENEGYEEVQMANLFGKAPIWAIAKADKAKMLTQDFSKALKQAMESIKNKLGTKDEVLQETVEDIDIIDTPSGGTTVGTVKNKKTIIDSPELNESVFYSGLEARLMDPNTPKTFNSADDFFKFLQNKQISKPELEDNILNRYVELSGKNKTPLVTSDMLEIIRQSPMRHIDSVTYGDELYGGIKRAKYGGGHYESGEIPGSYREDVLYVPSNKIPLDPDSLPVSGHDFTEKYVIGWSRLTDRKATLPVDKTAQGIAEQVDPAMIRTLKRNQKKLDTQLKGLETSALRKLEREGLVDIDRIDDLTMAEVRNVLNEGDNMARLNSIDPALEQQILQFRMKIDEDVLKLQKMQATTEGQQVTVTFADEIQSDVLQQAKRLEEKFKQQLGDLMDKNLDFVKEQIRASQRSYRGDFRDMNPEVAEYFLRNKSVFRPIFQSATEMQQFMNEYAKTQFVLKDLAKAGLRPDKQLVIKAREARAKQSKMLQDLETAMSEQSMKMLFPNVPFKNRMEWGSVLIKRDLAKAANRLYGPDKVDGAAQWYAISPAKKIINRYNQSGSTSTPFDQRTKDMKGIGTEEFYGGPDSTAPRTSPDTEGKHYTSTLEKILKTAAQENNSEIKIINVNGVGDSFAIKITPEMLLPHKTHRKDGGMVYTPEIIDIFEAA